MGGRLRYPRTLWHRLGAAWVTVLVLAVVAVLGQYLCRGTALAATPPPVIVVTRPGETFANPLSTPVSSLLPGAAAAREAAISNASGQSVAAFTLTLGVSPMVPLVSSPAGLTMRVEDCSAPWRSLSARGCSGSFSSTTTIPLRRVAASGIGLTGLAAARPGGTDYLLVVLALPSSATESLAGETTTLSWSLVSTLLPAAVVVPVVARHHHRAAVPLSPAQMLARALRGPLPKPVVAFSWMLLFGLGLVGGIGVPEVASWMRRFVSHRSFFAAVAAAGALPSLTVSWAVFALIGFALGVVVRVMARSSHRFIWRPSMAEVPRLPSPQAMLTMLRANSGQPK